MALRITERGGLFPNKLYKMVENEADDFIKWSKAGNWILICSDQQKFLSSAILTKYSMKNSFQNFVRQLNYYGFFAFKEEQKIAKAAGQLEIDPAYLYFRHESNCFKKGHPELLQRIKKSTRVTKRLASSMEENASNTETYPESLPKTRKTRKGNEASEGDSRLGGTEIAKPSYRSQGQRGLGFITSCTVDSQSLPSTASQMRNTDNIHSSHGEGSENGDLNNDSSLHFKEERVFPDTIYNHVCAEYQEDQGRLYGVHIPRWCTNGEDLPDVYKVITRHLRTKGSDAISTILEASNLSEDLLHHIKSIANKSVPGKWSPLELRITLGLVALAQKGTEKDQLTLEKLTALKRVPIPSFYGDIAQQLTTTTQDSGGESGCFTEDQGNQEYVGESPVTINPKEGPPEGKVPFSLEFKNIPISESVEYLLVEFGNGNVVEACRPRNLKNTWFGHTPPSNTSETVTVDVTIKTPDEAEVGKTSYTYLNEEDAAFTVVLRCLAQDEFNGEQQANPEKGENSAPSSFFGFSKQGEGSSVNIMRRLVFSAARVGAEHFIRIIFGTSNGRVVYETYKTESLFPEDIAAANGHDSIAAYLISQSKRFCEESNTSQRQSKDVNWRELLEAIEDKEARSRRKKTRRKDEAGDYITESMSFGYIEDSSDSDQERTEGRKEAKKKEVERDDISANVYFGDNEDSSDSDPGRTEGHPDPYGNTTEKMFLGNGTGGSYDGSEEQRTEVEIVCKRDLYKVDEEDATFYGKESLSVDESCEVDVDEQSSDSPQLPVEDAHDIIQSKIDQDTKSKMVLNAKDLLLGSLDLQSLVDDLVTIPDAKSNMVLNAKDLLPGSLDLQSLVDDLGKLVNFIRVAYNGVAGNTEVQIKVQRVGYKIAMLADKSAITVYQFKSASQSVLQELKGTYQYLLDGLEEMALETLSMLTEEAAAMVMAADELHSDFEKATDDVRDALENTQKAKGAEEEEKKTREKERQEFESRVKQAGQRQKNALEAEAKAQALYDQAQAREDKAMDKQDSLLSALASVFTGTISAAKGAATRNVQKAAEEMKKIGSGYIEAMKMANQEKMKHLDELQKEREVRQKAIVEWIEFAEKIKRCEDDNKLAEAAIEALHGSIGALKSLSAIMMKAAVFWQQMKSHCESLAKGEMQRSVETAMKYPEEKRLKVWTSKGFKEKAVQYYSKWVALDDVCGVYMLQIRDTSQHLYNYLTENPTIEQAKNNVRQLATEFAKDLKQAQGKLAEDQQKALDEKKSLEEK